MDSFETINVNNISELSQTVQTFRKADIPLLILGPPGIGKSEGLAQSLYEGDRLIDIRASQRDPIDIIGAPATENVYEKAAQRLTFLQHKLDHVSSLGDERRVKEVTQQITNVFSEMDKLENLDVQTTISWSRPPEWPTDGSGIIALEEINTAPTSVANTLLQPLGSKPGVDRWVGSHRIPKEYYWVATGNRKEDFAHVVPMSAPFRNRLHILNIDAPNVQGWTNWALNNDVHEYVVAYIRFEPGMLYQPPNKNDDYVGFPSPRSWARNINALTKQGLVGIDLFAGSVGQAAAIGYHTYVTQLRDMPDPLKLLQGKLKYDAERFKNNISIIYALVTSFVKRCSEDTSLLPNAMKIASQFQPEHTAIFVSNMLQSKNAQTMADVLSTRAIVEWAQKHRTLIEAEAS